MKTILVVDDDKMNLMTAKRLLAKLYRVITVNSGEMALTYLGRNIPDLILLDIKMPEMSGFDVMNKLRDNEEWKYIPVIFLTADRDSETELQCFEMGAKDYIVKPFVPAVMMSRIQRTIELESYKKDLEGAIVLADKVVRDNNIITSCGAGAAYDFGFMLLDYIKGNCESGKEISASMRYPE